MSELHRTPYVALDADGEALGARVTACTLTGALNTRAVAEVGFDDPDGSAAAAAPRGAAVQLRGGRLGGGEAVLLTGTVSQEPVRTPGNRRELRLTLGDGWAVADATRVTATLRNQTPQDLLAHLLDAAGLTGRRLSAEPLPPRRLVMLEEWTLAKAAKEVAGMWALDNSDQAFDRKLGLASRRWHWVQGFTGGGTFYWEHWPDGPQAQAAPLELTEHDLTRLEREQTPDGEKGRLECFFDPRLVPGLRVTVAGTAGRIEERRHRYDGRTFRTEAVYGPVPG